MGKLFNMTTMVSVLLGLVVYFMVIAPMMAKKKNGNGTTPTNGAPTNGDLG